MVRITIKIKEVRYKLVVTMISPRKGGATDLEIAHGEAYLHGIDATSKSIKDVVKMDWSLEAIDKSACRLWRKVERK